MSVQHIHAALAENRLQRIELTAEQKAVLRTIVTEAIEACRRDVSDTDDRLAAFFGHMVGRAGFDGAWDALDALWGGELREARR